MKRFTTGGTRPRPAHAAPTSAPQRMEAANDGRIRVHQGAAGWLRASRLTKRGAHRVPGAVAGAGPHDPRSVDIVGTPSRRGAAVRAPRIPVSSSAVLSRTAASRSTVTLLMRG